VDRKRDALLGNDSTGVVKEVVTRRGKSTLDNGEESLEIENEAGRESSESTSNFHGWLRRWLWVRLRGEEHARRAHVEKMGVEEEESLHGRSFG